MPDERDDATEPIEDEKPTITIAERQAAAETDSQPTITIAEREREDDGE